jgi:hypothetical protein
MLLEGKVVCYRAISRKAYTIHQWQVDILGGEVAEFED